jgi:hypothetical protein
MFERCGNVDFGAAAAQPAGDRSPSSTIDRCWPAAAVRKLVNTTVPPNRGQRSAAPRAYQKAVRRGLPTSHAGK